MEPRGGRTEPAQICPLYRQLTRRAPGGRRISLELTTRESVTPPPRPHTSLYSKPAGSWGFAQLLHTPPQLSLVTT